MTRQDAVKLATAGYGALGNYGTPAQAFVDMAVALGLLKLDEPKTGEENAIEALCRHEYMPNPVFLKNRLSYFGLKIVEA